MAADILQGSDDLNFITNGIVTINQTINYNDFQFQSSCPDKGSALTPDGIRTSLRNASRPKCDFLTLSGLNENEKVEELSTSVPTVYAKKSTTTNDHICAICQKNFKLKLGLIKHMKQSHGEVKNDGHICSICQEVFPTKLMYDKHLRTSFDCRPFKCQVCSKTFTRRHHLERHSKVLACSSSPAPSFPCEICGTVFNRKDNLMYHLRVHSGEVIRKKREQCKTCGKMFAGASLLKIHERVHTGERPFSCQFCDKSFASSGSLSKHSRVHTGEKPYQCQQCDARFSLKGTLNRHVRIHTGNRPHKCPHCDKEFIQAGGLKAHMFHHTGKNGFECEVCKKVFNRKARLQMHIKYVHEKNKPFSCEQCNKQFTRKEDLQRHQFLHSGKKPHECPTCFKTFAIKPSLKLHLLTHTKEKPRACHECGRAFIRKDCLIRHMRRHHKNLLDKIPVLKDGTLQNQKSSNLEDFLQVANITSGKSKDCPISPNAPYLRPLTVDELCEHIKKLLTLLVDEETLRTFGWPDRPVDQLLEAVIRRCGHAPADPKKYEYVDRLKENSKLLFTVVIDDNAVKTLLNNQTVDEVIQHVLHLAKTRVRSSQS